MQGPHRPFTSLLALATLVALQPAVALAHTPSAPPASSYTVAAGDSIFGIARKLNVRLRDLLNANHITITSTIHPGDTLVVPSGGAPGSQPSPSTSPSASSETPASVGPTNPYTVKPGDSLYAIARRSGVTLSALLAANSFTVSSTIMPGQVIKVPVTTADAPAAPQSPAPAAGLPAPAPVETLITYLRAQVGKPYKFFTAGPDTFDCSGLVVAGYRQIGVTLPHQSRMQSNLGAAVNLNTEPIIAGDLIFMVSSVDPTRIGHVGIALDASTWIQAVAPGTPVRVRPIPNFDKISAVRRILGA